MISRKILHNWLAYLYTGGIILVTVWPTNTRSPGFTLNNHHILNIRLDHLVHALIFIPWVVLIWLATRIHFRILKFKSAAFVSFCLLFAAAMEFVQYFLPYRTFSIIDLLANGTGVLLGFILLLFFKN